MVISEQTIILKLQHYYSHYYICYCGPGKQEFVCLIRYTTAKFSIYNTYVK